MGEAGNSQSSFEGKLLDGLDNVREIMGDAAATDALHQQLRRVDVILPADLQQPTSWETLAAELSAHPCVLCIVDRRDDARILHGLLPPGAIHLSGLMCGQHRVEKIAMIKQQLKAGEPIRVVSTQLVEAGVLGDWLSQPDQPFADKTDLLDGITQSDMNAYLAAQTEAMLFLDWVKKLASAFLAREEEASS